MSRYFIVCSLCWSLFVWAENGKLEPTPHSFRREAGHLGSVPGPDGRALPGSGTAAPRIGARPLAPIKLCVCQYQTEPTRCFRHDTKESCRSENDCLWATEGEQPVCRNYNQHYCDIEFRKRGPAMGCTRYAIVPASEPPPACGGGAEEYFYTYHGHGPRFVSLVRGLRDVVRRSAYCHFIFEDQTCGTFGLNGNDTANGLEQMRTIIRRDVAPLLRAPQRLTMTANQLTVYSLSAPPYVIHNAPYSFVVDHRGIAAEHAGRCDAVSPLCRAEVRGAAYVCDSGNGIQRQLCCCEGARCDWRTDVARCP